MTRKDLEDFSIKQKWTKARISFLEEQIKTLGKLTSIISDMPKGSNFIQDKEAENIVKLIDQIKALEKEISDETVELEIKIKEQLNLLQPKYGLLLYHYYILGHSIKYIAKDILHYREKYVYDLKKEALDEFEKNGGKNEESKSIYE